MRAVIVWVSILLCGVAVIGASLKPDPQNTWIGKAAADSLTAKLSTIPGMFLSEPDQVRLALGTQTTAQRVDWTEPSHAAQAGKALDVR